MKYVIFAFSSRAQTMKFYENARRVAPCSVINTPREASVGCGLSVKTNGEYYAALYSVLAGGGYDSFLGVFAFDGSKLVRLYPPIIFTRPATSGGKTPRGSARRNKYGKTAYFYPTIRKNE